MPDQPTDLRTLAAEAIAAHTLGHDLGITVEPGNPWAQPNGKAQALADAVLAAVLPAHRAEVLAEAAEAIASRRSRFAKSIDCDTAIEVLEHLAADGPTTGPAPRQSDEQPQVPPVPPNDPPEAHSGSQDDATASATVVRQSTTASTTAADCGHDLDAYARQADELARLRARYERLAAKAKTWKAEATGQVDGEVTDLRAELAQARADVERLGRERDEYAAESRRLGDFANAKVQEIKDLRGQRIVAAVFGHHKNAPRSFALHRPGFGPIADGVEFSDGRVALRELRQGLAPRVTTYDRMATLVDGHPDDFGADGVQIVWLSDELEPLADMEADRDRLADTVRRVRDLVSRAEGDDFDLTPSQLQAVLDGKCCDMHNRNCEPPSELCCDRCTEAAHDTFPIRHADGSTCVLDDAGQVPAVGESGSNVGDGDG